MQNGKNPKPRKTMLHMNNIVYNIESFIQLPKVLSKITTPFLRVIETRKSERKYSILTIKELSNLLWYSAKVKSLTVSQNTILSHRNAPSAGAIHPIDIFISLPSDLKNRALLYYEPFTHKLARLILDNSLQKAFFHHVNLSLALKNATLIWFGADFNRTKSKYSNPESLVWRDAGAKIMLVQLVANAFEYTSCAIGTLGNPYFEKLFSNSLVSAGGLLVGGGKIP